MVTSQTGQFEKFLLPVTCLLGQKEQNCVLTLLCVSGLKKKIY